MSKLNKFLIILIAIIILIIGALGYYKLFAYHSNKTENIELDSKLSTMLSDFPYSKIVEDKISYEELNKVYMLSKVIDDSELIFLGADKANLKKDIDGISYPKYKDKSIQYYAKTLGLSVAEIEKIDIDIWEKLLEKENFLYIFDGEKFIDKFVALYGKTDIFNNSFVLYRTVLGIISGATNEGIISYDKNIDKIIYQDNGVLPGQLRNIYVTSSKKIKEKYIIEFVEGFIGQGEKYSLNIGNKNSIEFDISTGNIKKAIENVLKQNQDKLNKYEIIFNKENDNYIFESIKKLDA